MELHDLQELWNKDIERILGNLEKRIEALEPARESASYSDRMGPVGVSGVEGIWGTLPEKLSELVTVALDAAGKLDRDRFQPMVSSWHYPDPETGRCRVCLGGMIIAGPLGGRGDRTINPQDFGAEFERKLQAVESFRRGQFVIALQGLGVAVDPTAYARDSAREQMNRGLVYADGVNSCGRMARYSQFYTWEDFDRFVYYAREVVVVLEGMGY